MFQNGMFYSPERIDEMTETPDLSSAPEPLILNMSKLRSINSYGIRNMIKMVRDWGSRKLEYHECPSIFIDSVNVVQSMLGTPQNTARIKSFAIPHYCVANDTTYDVMVNVDEIKIDSQGISIPELSCDECDGELELDCSLEEYLLFLEHHT